MTEAISTALPVTTPSTHPSPTCCQSLRELACKIGRCIAAPFIAIYHWICPLNPVTNKREFRLIPTCAENFIGRAAYNTLVVQAGGEILESDPQYGHYATIIREVVEDLVAKCPRQDLHYECKLLRAEEHNAWCLPGGMMGFNVGLMLALKTDTSDYGVGQFTLREKVAAVLSHEITHAAARHGGRKLEFSLFIYGIIQAVKYAFSYFARRGYDQQIEQTTDPVRRAELMYQRAAASENCLRFLNPVTSWFVAGIKLCGSRSHELEADKYGMHLMADMKGPNYNHESPKAAIWLMHFFQAHHSKKTGVAWVDGISKLCNTHPTPEERILANKETWADLRKITPP